MAYSVGTITIPSVDLTIGEQVTITGSGTAWNTTNEFEVNDDLFPAIGGRARVISKNSATSLTVEVITPLTAGSSIEYSILYGRANNLGARREAVSSALSFFQDRLRTATGSIALLLDRATTAGEASIEWLTNSAARFRMALNASDNLVLQRSTDGVTWNTALTINNSTGAVVANGLASQPNAPANSLSVGSNGIVSMAHGSMIRDGCASYSEEITIADNAFATITPSGRFSGNVSVVLNGHIAAGPLSRGGQWLLAWSDNPANLLTYGELGNIAVETGGAPTGTTGPDGRITIYVGGAAGTFFIENRAGFTVTVQLDIR
ncbi:MAG: hypothetical protein AAGG72_02725 [Pseudomonadota bacterium]